MRIATSVSGRLFAWAVALFPVTFAIVVHTGYRPTPLSIEVPKRPSLVFHQYAVDLRTIRQTTIEQAHYVFQNHGTEPVHITNVKTSCGCLTPLIEGARENIVEPGGQGRVLIRMQPANSTVGPHEYTVNVEYADPEPREVQLTLKLTIPDTMLVDPPAMSVYHPKGCAPTVQDFTITDARGKRFEVTDVSINTELVEAVIGETNRTASGKFQQTVRVTIASILPAEKKTYLLRIKTSDPQVPELRVPILLYGQGDASDSEGDHEHTSHSDAKIDALDHGAIVRPSEKPEPATSNSTQ